MAYAGAVNSTDGATGSLNESVMGASYDFGVVKAGVSYGENHNDTNTKTVTLSKSIIDIDFTLSYIKAEKDTTSSLLNKDREYVTLSASKTF